MLGTHLLKACLVNVEVLEMKKSTLVELVSSNMEYARGLARRFYLERLQSGLERGDFESAAYLGLCDAAARYDSDKSENFRAYAFLRIHGAMVDLVRRAGFITRKEFAVMNSLTLFTEDDNGCGLRRRPILISFADILLEAGIKLHFNEHRRVIDLSYSNGITPESISINRASKAFVRVLLDELPDKEKRVLFLKYYENMTFEQMSDQFNGATRSWLCRIHARALARLRTKIAVREERCNELLRMAA